MAVSFDFIVIGGGSAGYAAARTARAAGLSVAVIEGAKEIGGLCILRGCMPSKALLESSNRWHDLQRAREFGLKAIPLHPDLKAIQRRKDLLIDDFAGYRRRQLARGDFTFIRGHARFTGPRQLEVVAGKKRQIVEGRAFLIATGSEVTRVPVPGLAEAGYWTSDEVLRLKRLPKRVAVLGGGVVAVELAQYLSRLGTRVTIIQRSPHLVKENDEEASVVLETAFREEGITLHLDTQLDRVTVDGKEKQIFFRHKAKRKSVKADEIFYALGRQPSISTLNLDAAGVGVDRGRVTVNAGMQTSIPYIFAAGDVTGLHEVVHTAIQQGEVAARNAARLERQQTPLEIMDDRLKAAVTFTDPEIAVVGLTEKEAQAQGLDYLAASYPFHDHGKSMIMGVKHGFVKLIAEKTRGEIVGGQIVGPHAADLIHEIIVLMRYRGTAAELATMPHYHPTLAEILTYPAEEIAEKLSGK